MAQTLHRHHTLQKRHSFKLSNRHHWNLRVILYQYECTFENDHPHPEPDDGKN